MRLAEALLLVWATLVTRFFLSQFPLASYASSLLHYTFVVVDAYKIAVVSVSGDLPALLHIFGLGLNIASFAIYAIPLWSFLTRAKDLGTMTCDTNRLVQRVANKLDLSDARKIASRVSRKDLHRITENSLRRRMKQVQTRLDATHFKLVQQEMLNNTLAQTNSEFQTQLDAAASKHDDKAKAYDELVNTRDQAVAQIKAMNKLREDNSQLSTEMEALQRAKTEAHTAQEQHMRSIATKDEEAQKLQSQHATALAEKDNEIAELRNAHAKSSAPNDAEMQAFKANLTQTLTAKTTKHQAEAAKQAEILAATNTALSALCDEQRQSLDQARSGTAALQNDHQSALAKKDNELQALREDHIASLAARNTFFDAERQRNEAALQDKSDAMKIAQGSFHSAIAEKDAELQDLRNEHKIALASKNSEVLTLQSRVDTLEGETSERIRELEDQLSTAKQAHASELRDLHTSYKVQMQSQHAEGTSDQDLATTQQALSLLKKKHQSYTERLEMATEKSEVVKKEWMMLQASIEQIGSQLPSVFKEIGKKLYLCSEEISLLVKDDKEMKLKAQQAVYSIPLEIRGTRFMIETVWDHHFKFLRTFGRELSVKYPDMAALSKSITDKMLPAASLPPAPSQQKSVPPQAPKPRPSAVSGLSVVGSCLCGYQFLRDESPDVKQDHIDRCPNFERADQAIKEKTLKQIGLRPATSKQSQSQKGDITCRTCKQVFAASVSAWFHNTHIKVCKQGSRGSQNRTGSSPVVRSPMPQTRPALSTQNSTSPASHAPKPAAPFNPSTALFTPSALSTNAAPEPVNKVSLSPPGQKATSSGGLKGYSKYANNTTPSNTPATATPATANKPSTDTPRQQETTPGGLKGYSKYATNTTPAPTSATTTPATTNKPSTDTPVHKEKPSGGFLGRSKYADASYVTPPREQGQLIEKRV